jgi:hypothetical protein
MHRLFLRFLAAAAIVAAPATALEQAPPREVTDRLEKALHALKPGSFQGTYSMTIKSSVSKLDGSEQETEEQTLDFVQAATGEPQSRVVRASKDGKDVTADRQKEHEDEQRDRQAKAGKDDKKGSNSVSVTASVPAGESAAWFEFGVPSPEGDLLVAGFTPRSEHRDKEGITQGRMAWNAGTLEPVWVEARLLKLPKHASDLSMRFEIRREGEMLVLGRMVTDGAGGILWIKRRIHAEMETSEIRPAR